MNLRMRAYDPFDARDVVALWDRCLRADPITREIFEENVLLDPNFDPTGCRVAELGSSMIGFAYALTRRTPLPWGFESEFERDREVGWVFALFVEEAHRRQGIGSELLQEALEFLRAKGVRRVVLGNYAPNYVLSGVDTQAYPGAQEFFVRHGFEVEGQSFGMGIDLHGFRRPPEAAETEQTLGREGIVVECFSRDYLLPTLAFLEECFPTWLSLLIEKLRRGDDHREMVIARRGTEVIGYCQRRYGHHAERTGPFGVRADFRGKRIGTLMLYHLLERMAEEGLRFGWFAQTGERQRHYYQRVGYRAIRTHVEMSRRL
jgi:GNAT superfamily N-acetyltransferase